jgi:zinc protease
VIALMLAVACAPKIDPGPIPAAVAAAPVRVIDLQDPDSPLVYLQAVIAAGSSSDRPGQEGLAALTANSLVEAGAGEWSGAELRAALYPSGADLEVLVDRDLVSLRLTCHRDHAALCLDAFASALTAPRFDASDVDRLRDEALYAVTDGMLEDIEALGGELLQAWLYEGHPYGHPPSGRAGAIPVLDRDAVARFYSDRYVRESVIVGIAGGYDDDLRAALDARLLALPGAPAPDRVMMSAVAVDGRSLLVAETADASVGFHLGHPLDLDRNDPDHAALYLAMNVFGAHRESHGRLYGSLRTARGLTYGSYAYAEPFVQRGWSSLPENGAVRRQGYFSLWIRPVASDNAAFALKLAIDELEQLVDQGLTEGEFDDARAYLRGWVPLLAQDLGRRLAFELDAAASGTPLFLDDLPARLEALTREDVNGALRRHIHPDTLRIVAVGGEGTALRQRLVEDESTPIVYADVSPGEAQAARDAEIATKDLGIPPDHARVVEAEGIFR